MYAELSPDVMQICKDFKNAKLLYLINGHDELWKLGADHFMAVVNALMEA
jgi:hypothetical protein